MHHPLVWLVVTLTSCTAYAGGPLDRHPPELAVEGPTGVVREQVTLRVEAADRQGLTVEVRAGDLVLPVAGEEVRLDTRALGDGVHTVTVTATDRSLRRNRTERALTLEVDNTPPRIAAHLTPLAQGRTGALFVAADEPVTVEARVLDEERPLYPVGEGRWRALIGVPASWPAGVAPLVVRAVDRAGNHARITRPVEVLATAFDEGGFIPIAPDPDPDPDWVATLDRLRCERDDACELPRARQLWSGPLRQPVEGRRTSPYGKLRTYIGGLKRHHEGVDFANAVGTPVVAAAAGEVVLAREEPVYGRTVIVHHGHGLATSYNHLSSIEVALGDRVEAGQEVGRLGSTGISTGPHLHWGLTVDGVPVDAEQWLTTGFELTAEIEAALRRRRPERASL